jgi:hypothetical protein
MLLQKFFHGYIPDQKASVEMEIRRGKGEEGRGTKREENHKMSVGQLSEGRQNGEQKGRGEEVWR